MKAGVEVIKVKIEDDRKWTVEMRPRESEKENQIKRWRRKCCRRVQYKSMYGKKIWPTAGTEKYCGNSLGIVMGKNEITNIQQVQCAHIHTPWIYCTKPNVTTEQVKVNQSKYWLSTAVQYIWSCVLLDFQLSSHLLKLFIILFSSDCVHLSL